MVQGPPFSEKEGGRWMYWPLDEEMHELKKIFPSCFLQDIFPFGAAAHKVKAFIGLVHKPTSKERRNKASALKEILHTKI